ncbi:hypothetical protein ACIRBZ_22390 [Streptomyces sp. NPDC094038]|uniref:hypothetical protein n=1 Tax=Streptomyces sp. NPDC094038 TaxID=3366055 RepID=UPI0038116651
MTAEHDAHEAHDAHDAHDEYDEYDGRAGRDGRADDFDALFAVLMDEPLTDGQRADAAFMAEHRAATADVALLRDQIGVIADTLGEPRPQPQPQPQPRVRPAGRRRPWQHPGVRALGFAGALAAAFASAVFGLGWLVSNGADSKSAGSSADSAAGSTAGGAKESLDGARFLACARLVVEGTVTGVHEVPHTGRERVTLKVTRAYKPAKPAAEVDVLFEADADSRIRQGALVLVAVRAGQQVPDRYAVGETRIAAERSWIVRDLPESRTLTCPDS